MGRRISSFEKIEKIAKALKIPPSRLFVHEASVEKEEQKPKTKDYLRKMPAQAKKELASRLMVLIKTDIAQTLNPKNYETW